MVLGNVLLTSSLIGARLAPRLLVNCFAVAGVVNVGANVLLIPSLGATGAALAMLLTELVLGVIMLGICVRAVGSVPVVATLGPPLAAGAVMALVLLAPFAPLAVRVVLAVAAYGAALLAVERLLSPEDFAFVRTLVAARVRARRGGAGQPT